jgi:CENP-S associating Centromere protein X
MVGKYVEVFVREAIMRASYESRERAGGGDGGMGKGEGLRAASDHGWLEVEDLEKVSAQLCLDF